MSGHYSAASSSRMPTDGDGGRGGLGVGPSEGELKSDSDCGRRRDTDRRKRSARKDRRSSSEERDRYGKDSRSSSKHKKKSHRRRSSSRSRSRSRERSSPDRRRRHNDRDERRRRSRSRSFDSRDDSGEDGWGNSGSRNEHSNKVTYQETYKTQTPNSTVMIRGLPPHISENEIRQDLIRSGIFVKDIRLIRHRDTGNSRGFAFAEFHTVQDAEKWMELKKGTLVLPDKSEGNLIYSVSKSGGVDITGSSDWNCLKCRAYNFKRREICYKCNEPKPPEADSELACEISVNPTSIIMLFELDALTTEDVVLQAFQNHPLLASLPIRSVKVPRESGTNLSRRVCFVESNNVADSVRLFEAFSEAELEIDGVKVQAVYHKPYVAPKTKNPAAMAALAAAQWNNTGSHPIPPPPDESDTEKMAEYSASLYAKNDAEYISYLDYYRNYYTIRKLGAEATAAFMGPTSASAPVTTTCSSKVSSTVNKPIELTASGPQTQSADWSASAIAVVPVVPPDSSRFQYDETSGYYFDPVSGYYYDPTNQYYYDSKTQQFLQWDAQRQLYIVTAAPVTTAPSANGSNSGVTVATKSKSSSSKEKEGGGSKCPAKKPKSEGKVAKNIAKEMERWAKGLNQKREYVRETDTISRWSKVESNSGGESQDGTTLPSTSDKVKKKLEQAIENSSSESDGQSEEKAENEKESNEPDLTFLDTQKIACLLCKRQFSSVEILLKHAKMSDLHKQNLEEVLGSKQSEMLSASTSQSSSKSGYRDRAKERRLKFGSEHEVITSSTSIKDFYIKVKEPPPPVYEEPNKEGIKEDNIGSKMLQKMGWQAGEGLGREKKGIVDPIKTERRVGKFGLGLDVNTGVNDSDDRVTKARKLTLARYSKLI